MPACPRRLPSLSDIEIDYRMHYRVGDHPLRKRSFRPPASRRDAWRRCVFLSAIPGFAIAIFCVLALQTSERPLRTGVALFLAATALAVLFLGGAAR
jgi:hypothetical protein